MGTEACNSAQPRAWSPGRTADERGSGLAPLVHHLSCLAGVLRLAEARGCRANESFNTSPRVLKREAQGCGTRPGSDVAFQTPRLRFYLGGSPSRGSGERIKERKRKRSGIGAAIKDGWQTFSSAGAFILFSLQLAASGVFCPVAPVAAPRKQNNESFPGHR